MTEMHWLTDERYAKLTGQMRLRFNTLLVIAYPMHGYKDLAPGVTNALMEIVEESWDIIRGQDKPLPEPDIRRWE